MSATSSRRSLAANEPVPFNPAPGPAEVAPWLSVVAEKVKGMHYGTLQITVHDSRVVQIERTERTRFELPKGS